MQKPVTSKIPHGVGCPPPPGMDPRKGKGKLMCIKVRMLDDSVGVFHLGHKAAGQALFDEVCRYLNLLENDYFGLEFIDSFGNRCWLDKEKSILRQILVAQSDARFLFIVKFYTPNPAELEEEYTRYLFALQIRRDLSRGELLCTNENTAALLVALIVQSECGDFSPLDYSDANVYLAGTHFVPQQTPAFAQAVMEQHRRLIGMEPAEADFTLLETARRCDFYGLRLHPARDIEGTEVALAVAHMGIKVFHQMNCVTTFSWAKVRKFSFKRKRLMIKVHPDSFQFYKETIEFSFENRDDCKNFWKKCVEHHSFFRCAEPVVIAGAKGEDGGRKQHQQQQQHHHHLFTRGSNFQYRGRTQKQLIDYVREHRKRREPFQRPLRRGNAMFTGGGTNFGTNSLGRAAQFLVSDRMAKDSEAMGNGQHRNSRVEEANFACTFPSLCAQHQQQQKLQNGGKGRPKSALLSDEKRYQKSSKQQQQQQPQLSMQNSYHAGMAQRQENGIATEAHQNSLATAAETMALFHQHMDPMCMSMPNVLLTTDSPIGPSAAVAPKLSPPSVANASSSFLYSAHKSVSGENFHYAAELREDNLSEGSYRIGGRGVYQRLAAQQKDGTASSTASSQSDVSAVHSPVDPRVYQTTFTTKRVGNVIMKRVMNNDITPTPTAVGADVKPSAHRRPPLTSRSAVDAGDPGDESDSLASSSAAFSDYSLAATAPPSACYPPATTVSGVPSFARSTATGRIRCTPSPTVATQQHQSIPVTIANQVLLPVHLRNEVPVPIDAPPPVNIVSRPGQQQQQQPAMSTKTTIIRPVLLPSPATTTNSLDKSRTGLSNNSNIASAGSSCIIVKRRPSSSTASSASTPTQSTTAQRRPVVVAKASPSPPPPILHINGGLEAANTKQNRQKEDATNRESDGNSSCDGGRGDGPMPGRVIRRQDLEITAGGIALRGAKNGESVVEKPKVLPKPDLDTLMGLIGQHKQPETNRNLVDPLESILKDVRSMNEALDGLESPTGSGGTPRSQSSQKVGAVAATAADEQQQAVSSAAPSRRRPPDAISVESDEWPSVRTLHLFNNGNNRVPYTLTVRDLSGGQTTTIRDGEEKQREGAALALSAFSTGGCGRSRNATAPEGPLAMIGGAALRHKSLELVQRKRLPAQGAFSSQDHSITATSPEAGNVFEYVVSQRRRSASSDRTTLAHSNQCQQNRRVANRRQTQPVEMVGKWTTCRGEDIQISANLTEEKGEKSVGIMPSEVLGIPTQNSEDSASTQQQQQRVPQQLLETDF